LAASWSDGGAQTHTITVPDSDATYTANYAAPVTVTSSPGTGSGYVTVDSTPVSTPYTASWIVGSTHTIAAASPVSCGLGCQYVWQSWSDGGAQSHTITVPSAATTYTATFQQQFQLTMAVDPSGAGSTTPAAGTYWYDADSAVPISATPASGFEFVSWSATGPGYSGLLTSTTITMTGPIAETANFQRIPLVTLTVSYQVNGGGAGFSAPTMSYVEGGVNKTYTLTQTPAAVAVDKGSAWSVAPNPLGGSNSSERWYADQALSGTATSNATIVFAFQHQYSLTLSYSVSGGGSGYSPPSFTGTLNGGSTSVTLAAAPSPYWFDAGTQWSVAPNPLAGSTSSERWFSSQPLNGTVASAITLAFNYQHQYLLSMLVNPSGAATTTPQEGSSWQVAGATVTIQASPTRGAFQSWTGTGSGSYSGTENPATVTISSPINETANIVEMANVRIESSIQSGSGAVIVDGESFPTPYLTTWLIGEQHNVSAPSPVSCGSGCQYDFAYWSDGGARTHTVTAQTSNITLTAYYVKEYSLTILSSVGGSTNPLSGTYWYVDGDVASVSASPEQGYSFTGWLLDGQNAGSSNPLLVTMSGPHTVAPEFTSLRTPFCVYVFTDPVGLLPAPTMTPSSCPMLPGTVVTVTAQPISNWQFVEFTVTNTTFSRNNMSVTFTMPPASVSVVAHYKYVGSGAPSGGLAVPAGDVPITALFSVAALAVLLARMRRRRGC